MPKYRLLVNKKVLGSNPVDNFSDTCRVAQNGRVLLTKNYRATSATKWWSNFKLRLSPNKIFIHSPISVMEVQRASQRVVDELHVAVDDVVER